MDVNPLLEVEVISPTKTIYQGQVHAINACGADGYFTILPRHAPLMAFLVKAELELTVTGQETTFVAIDTGFVEVQQNKVRVLTQTGAVALAKGQALAKMEQEQQERKKQALKNRDQLLRTELELYRLIRQTHEL